MILLDGGLKIESANQAFYRTFKLDQKQAEGKVLYELGKGQRDIPELRKLLGEILQQNNSFAEFRVKQDFPGLGKPKMLLNARRLQQDSVQKILLAMEDVTDRSTKQSG
jgi:two-component system, chemotaxis family, CheB/CheR fusion protein